jgi:hypothetical protein
LRNRQIAMTHSLAIRLNPANPDHHLWNNNGTWFVHYTIHPTPFTKERIRASLGTKDLAKARLRRDQLLWGPDHSLASVSMTSTTNKTASQTTER